MSFLKFCLPVTVAVLSLALGGCFEDQFTDDVNPRRTASTDKPRPPARLDLDMTTRADHRLLGADVTESCEYTGVDGLALLKAAPAQPGKDAGVAVIRIENEPIKLSVPAEIDFNALKRGGTFAGPGGLQAIVEREAGVTEQSGIDVRRWPAVLRVTSPDGTFENEYGRWDCGL